MMNVDMVLSAARGWLELGLPEEALGEIGQFDQVLSLKKKTGVWGIKLLAYQKLRKWKEALESADMLCALEPCQAYHWTNRAHIISATEGTKVAYLELLRVELNLQHPLIHYTLARFAAELKLHEIAKAWLEEAIYEDDQYRKMALQEPVLTAFVKKRRAKSYEVVAD